MTTSTLANSMKNEMDKANQNSLGAFFQKMRLGSFLRAMKTTLMKFVPTVGATGLYQLSTLDCLVLAEDAKAATILRAYARSGTGTLGELAIQAYGATPAAGQIAVAPNGDIVTLAADAYTSIDVIYEPMPHDVMEFTLNTVTGVATIPAPALARGVLGLIEAEILAGTTTGKSIVLVPLAGGGAGLPATTKAQLTSGKTTVSFNNATDAPTSVRVKLAVALDVNVDAQLTATAITF